MRIQKPIVTLGLLLCGVTTTAIAETGFTIIDVPGAYSTVASGINGQGDIVGTFFNSTGAHGFLLRAGSFTTIDVPGAAYTAAMGINARGDIVGGTNSSVGFLLSNGVFSTVDPGARFASASSINARGDIVGSFFVGGVKQFGFLWTGGISTIISHSVSTFATGINDQGDIVGNFDDLVQVHGYLLSAGQYTAIDAPGASMTLAQGINDKKEIVGSFIQTATHGFLLSNGAFTTLDVPGATHTEANGINLQGDIVGAAVIQGVTHGFVLSAQARSR